MEQARYFVGGRPFEASDPALQDALARAYAASERPRCMCAEPQVEMYIAKHAEYVVKRMPGTGHLHDPACPSFEPEPRTSGLGELLGQAIIEHAPDELEIATNFPLARVARRSTPGGERSSDPPAAVNARRHRMSLRALLHFLYDRAGFNRWYPGMAGKRTQHVICHYLTKAAQGVVLKGEPLDERLYVPEAFRVADKEAIAERRRRKLSFLLTPEPDMQFKMAILIGQLAGVAPSPFGRRIAVKHMPDVPLYIDDKAWQRAERAYASILQAADADVEHKLRVVLAALVYAKREHVYQIDALSLMLVTDQWVPLQGLHELRLIEELQRQNRSFVKPLPFDAKSPAAFANALLLDTAAGPTPLHVISPFLDPKERATKHRAIAALAEGAWVWETDKDLAALPQQRGERRASEGLRGSLGEVPRAAVCAPRS